MKPEVAEKIMHDFGKFMELTHGNLTFLFLNKVPESLLPYPKKKIEEALNIMAKHFYSIKNEKAVNDIETSNTFLCRFYVKDKDAIDSFVDRLKSKKYQLKKYFTELATKKQQSQIDYLESK